MSNESTLFAQLGAVTELINRSPRSLAILEQLREEGGDLLHGVNQIFLALEEDGLAGELSVHAQHMETAIASVMTEERPVMMHTSTGIPQLNPVLEAAIIERASLDGDVPEFRSGPLPEGASPAVPVLTDSLDPVQVGAQLVWASTAVRLRLAAATEAVENQLQKGEECLPLVPTGVEGYLAGQVPPSWDAPLQRVDQLSEPIRRRFAYNAIATTQGRRSIAVPIANRVMAILRQLGADVELGVAPVEVASADWKIPIFGAEDLNNLSFGEQAAQSLARALMKTAEANSSLKLEVVPLGNIPMRIFGWRAYLRG